MKDSAILTSNTAAISAMLPLLRSPLSLMIPPVESSLSLTITKGISITTRTMPCAGIATKPIRGSERPSTITTTNLRPSSSVMAPGSLG